MKYNELKLSKQPFGLLTAIKKVGSRKGYAIWLCICKCGNTREATSKHLKSGGITHCGDRLHKIKHGHTGSKLYESWCRMKSRCSKRNSRKDLKRNYSGRGIYVCKEWADNFEKFESWALGAGWNENLTLDREDNNGPYHPDNCRWVTRKVQACNQRSNKYIEVFGEKLLRSEAADRYGISRSTLTLRLQSGWSPEDAVSLEVNACRKERKIAITK